MASASPVYVSIDHSIALSGKGPWTKSEPLLETTFPAPGTHTATVILLHGFANSGAAWVPIVKHLQAQLPHIKFILPNAPVRTVHIPIAGVAGEAQLPAWWDVNLPVGLPRSWPGSSPIIDRTGLAEALATVQKLIDEEAALVEPGRVLLGGFSQGGILSHAIGLENDKVGGIISLSTWLPLADAVKSQDALAPSILKKAVFWGHGTADQLPQDFAVRSIDALVALGFKKIEAGATPAAGTVSLNLYEGLKHQTSVEELEDIQKWLSAVTA